MSRRISTLLVAMVAAHLVALPVIAQLPTSLDIDRDGWADDFERVIGSASDDKRSVPETSAIPGTCSDGIDNDHDGAVDAADTGCGPVVPGPDLEPEIHAFGSMARIPADATGLELPLQTLELEGPVVMRTAPPEEGASDLEMLAMQLSADTPQGRVYLLKDPQRTSSGRITSQAGDGSPPFDSTITVPTLLVVGGESISLEPVEGRATDLPHLPPIQDARKIDPERCYDFGGRKLHCPRVPELRIPVLHWVAKFDCGEQPSTPPPFWGPVKPGDYATKIVIYNPQDVKVKVRKKVSVGERNPKTGPRSEWETFSLPPMGTTEVDCRDIYRLLGDQVLQPKPGQPLPFLNGVVAVVSQKKLDVIGNYTLETPKEKIEFVLEPPKTKRPKRGKKRQPDCCEEKIDWPPELRKWIGRRLKVVTLITEDTIIDELEEVHEALRRRFPDVPVDKLRISILSTDIGVGSSLDIEAIQPQKCVLIDPPEKPEGRLDCPNP